MKKNLTYERLTRIVRYEPRSGKFFWILRDQRKRNIIILKHSEITGFMYLCLYGKWYPAQVLAFLFQKGKLCKKDILFINHVKSDFRWENLKQGRDLTRDPEVVIYAPTTISGIWFNREEKRYRVDLYGKRKKNNKIVIGFCGSFNQAVHMRWKAEKLFKFPGCYTTSESFIYLTNENLI